jgi:hypothetical protein
MARRKNVKRIDPRYFMDEKTERLDEGVMDTMKRVLGIGKKPQAEPSAEMEKGAGDFKQMMNTLNLIKGHQLKKTYHVGDPSGWQYFVTTNARRAYDMSVDDLAHAIGDLSKSIQSRIRGGSTYGSKPSRSISNDENKLKIMQLVMSYKERQ